MLRNTLLGLVVFALVLWTGCAGPLCWLLRDGLGPRAGDSAGWLAVRRFLLTFYWGPVALALVWLAALLGLWWMLEKASRGGEEE